MLEETALQFFMPIYSRTRWHDVMVWYESYFALIFIKWKCLKSVCLSFYNKVSYKSLFFVMQEEISSKTYYVLIGNFLHLRLWLWQELGRNFQTWWRNFLSLPGTLDFRYLYSLLLHFIYWLFHQMSSKQSL